MTPAPLVSFYCRCGTPLSAVVGTPSLVCHVCGTTVIVPPPTPMGYGHAPPRRGPSARRFWISMVVAYVIAVAIFLGRELFRDALRRAVEKGDIKATAFVIEHGDQIRRWLDIALFIGIGFAIVGTYYLVRAVVRSSAA